MRRLYWFQNDLRLADNPGLAAAAESDQLLLQIGRASCRERV